MVFHSTCSANVGRVVSLASSQGYQGVLDWVRSVGLEKLTDLNVALVAAQSLQGPLIPAGVSGHLKDLIGKIGEMGLEMRHKALAEIAAKIWELSGPLEQDVPALVLQRIASFLDSKSEARFAQASKASLGAVHQERLENLERFRNYDGLQERLSYFLNNPPSTKTPIDQQYVQWRVLLSEGSELFDVVQTCLESIKESSLLIDNEKGVFREKSVHDIVSDPSLLHSLLRTEYDRNLVVLSSGIELGQKCDLSHSPTLKEKAQAVRDHFQQRGADIRGIVCRLKKLTCIPKEIGLLTGLKKLALDNNLLRSIPEAIQSLQSLEELILFRNQLHTLPESIGSLTALRSLALFNNHLRSLPASIGLLQSLEGLYLSDNKLQSLPSSIGSLRSLVTFRMVNNSLKSLPDSIGSLRALKSLDLTNNQLESLPASINSLQGLEELFLPGNKLQSLPNIRPLRSLGTLYLARNPLKGFPESISSLPVLKNLTINADLLQSVRGTVALLRKRGVQIRPA